MIPISDSIPTARDKTLFTPGPLTTSLAVKQAMLRDAGSWHFEFNELVREVRERILRLAGVSQETGHELILMQGSGTFGVESVLATCVPQNGKLLILVNGAYGERMVLMAQHLRIAHAALRTPENEIPDLAELDRFLAANPEVTHLAAVHCETTTGILNPIERIGAAARRRGIIYLVDAMSSFGALPIDLPGWGIDYLISSPNKCLEGVPGFSFVIASRNRLFACEGPARSLSLDLIGQLQGFEKNGQFRFTPPTHSILAFQQALNELEMEGGIPARKRRYERNHQVLMEGMKRLGFTPYLDPEVQSCIISSFYYPSDPCFRFDTFYQSLSGKGFIIYPGKISQAQTFRIGSIGRLFEADLRALLAAIRETLEEMNVRTVAGG